MYFQKLGLTANEIFGRPKRRNGHEKLDGWMIKNINKVTYMTPN